MSYVPRVRPADSQSNYEEVPEKIRDRYSFPADREFMVKKFKDELNLNYDQKMSLFYQTGAMAIGLTAVMFYGGYKYICLYNPGGKVLRDLRDKRDTLFRYWARRVVPFVCIAGPVVFNREVYFFRNGLYAYRK